MAFTYLVSEVNIDMVVLVAKLAALFTFLVGELIFDRNHPLEPPDIIFSPKDDSTDFNPSIEDLPVISNINSHLVRWGRGG